MPKIVFKPDQCRAEGVVSRSAGYSFFRQPAAALFRGGAGQQ
jgi:hypothetical protein